jgi:hypothetical protein
MAGETQLWLRRLVQAVGVGLVAAAVVQELRKPREGHLARCCGRSGALRPAHADRRPPPGANVGTR